MSAATPSRRPYLIRAIVEWVLDSGHTPLLLVDANQPGVQVPTHFIDEEGRIILNVSPSAAQALELGNSEIRFRARFGGTPHPIHFPPGAVLAVYARETGDGMLLGDPEPLADAAAASQEAPDAPPPVEQPSVSSRQTGGRGHLKVVK